MLDRHAVEASRNLAWCIQACRRLRTDLIARALHEARLEVSGLATGFFGAALNLSGAGCVQLKLKFRTLDSNLMFLPTI